MDHFAEAQITLQGNVDPRRYERRFVLTPSQHPVELLQLHEKESREIADKLAYSLGLSKEKLLEDVHERISSVRGATMVSSRAYFWNGLQHHVSICYWLPHATRISLKADILAGLTVGVMAIPQSISYAAIAGMPYIYGMYSAFVPTILYASLGNSRQEVVGPVAIVCLLVESGLRGIMTEAECPAYYINNPLQLEQFELCPALYVKFAITLAFLVGLIQIIGGLLNVGFLVAFLGHPVLSGFTSGAAIIIGLTQLKDWFGYKIKRTAYVYDTLYYSFVGFAKVNGMTLGLGLLWFFTLLGMRYISGKFKRLAFLRAAGPLIMCFVGIAVVAGTPTLTTKYKVAIVGKLPEGVPPTSLESIKFDIMTRLVPTAITIALIGYLELIAIGKSLASKLGYELPAGHELTVVGITNLVCSCFSCFPVSGSFSRSAVNYSSGAQTQLSGFISGLIMLLTLLVLTPVFFYLPKFILASIIISSIIPLIAWRDAVALWHIKKVDCGLWVFTFLATLFLGIEIGIASAAALSLLVIVLESIRPQITVLWRLPETEIYRNIIQDDPGVFVKGVLIVRIGASMYFANVGYIREQIIRLIKEYSKLNPVRYVVLEMTPVSSIDSTAVHALEALIKELRTRNIILALATVGVHVEEVRFSIIVLLTSLDLQL